MYYIKKLKSTWFSFSFEAGPEVSDFSLAVVESKNEVDKPLLMELGPFSNFFVFINRFNNTYCQKKRTPVPLALIQDAFADSEQYTYEEIDIVPKNIR